MLLRKKKMFRGILLNFFKPNLTMLSGVMFSSHFQFNFQFVDLIVFRSTYPRLKIVLINSNDSLFKELACY